MARFHGSVLVDANVIIECHRTRSWRALAGGYSVETVEECVTETQTGFQRRKPEQRIDFKELCASLKSIHSVEARQRAKLNLRVSDIVLDRGEATLWAHAAHRDDAWLLCGPDKASLRFGIRLGFRERLVSLERLLDDAGHQSSPALREAYTENWHNWTVGQLVLAEKGGL